MRFLPNINYGTEGYPEGVARRLRTLNFTTWTAAAAATTAAVVHLVDPTPGLRQLGTVDAIAAAIFASVPLFHRFGPISAALVFVIVADMYFFALVWLTGTGSGVKMYYLLSTAFAILWFGTERVLLSVLAVVLAVALIVVLEILAPYNAGLMGPPMLLATFVFTTIVACTSLLAIVYYAVREAARAEAKLALEYETSQDKARQLENANKYKSHFLASASHDLRQPLHALNLFVAQLQAETDTAERERLASRIDTAVGSMNELFEALLDMTKLEAGILEPSLSTFPVARLLDRIETTFAEAARKKGLRFRIVACDAWVSSDPILLERILLNLVSNAVRYTERGGVVVGFRRRGAALRIDVCDSGVGVPDDQLSSIFAEYYRLARTGVNSRDGIGLGLAIVDRLGRLLGHPVEVSSRPGSGSRFSVQVPLTEARTSHEAQWLSAGVADPARGKRVMVVDDDALVLDGMRGILQSWGCTVETTASGSAALTRFTQEGGELDLIISDCRLAGSESGIDVIERLRRAVGLPVPAIVITGDTAPERLREASAAGLPLLHKPISPMALRTTVNRLLRAGDGPAAPVTNSADQRSV